MKPRIFLVRWKDACGGSRSGWRSVEEMKETKEASVMSMGVILHQDERRILLCPHVLLDEKGEVEEGDAEIAIPMDWVISVEEWKNNEPG